MSGKRSLDPSIVRIQFTSTPTRTICTVWEVVEKTVFLSWKWLRGLYWSRGPQSEEDRVLTDTKITLISAQFCVDSLTQNFQ